MQWFFKYGSSKCTRLEQTLSKFSFHDIRDLFRYYQRRRRINTSGTKSHYKAQNHNNFDIGNETIPWLKHEKKHQRQTNCRQDPCLLDLHVTNHTWAHEWEHQNIATTQELSNVVRQYIIIKVVTWLKGCLWKCKSGNDGLQRKRLNKVLPKEKYH